MVNPYNDKEVVEGALLCIFVRPYELPHSVGFSLHDDIY
jgi:hypothetical protein